MNTITINMRFEQNMNTITINMRFERNMNTTIQSRQGSLEVKCLGIKLAKGGFYNLIITVYTLIIFYMI